MSGETYKRYTDRAKLGIKGEAFFESTISDYAIPHHVTGPRDLGLDYICEWAHGDKPTGILFAVQVKTLSAKRAKSTFIEIEELNGLKRYHLACPDLDAKSLAYLKRLGLPIFLFAVVIDSKGSMNCFYKRLTQRATTGRQPKELGFYEFKAFAGPKVGQLGFARDLYFDHLRWSYHTGSISYPNPRDMGLQCFPEGEVVFADLFQEYRDRINTTYLKTGQFLESFYRLHPGKDQ